MDEGLNLHCFSIQLYELTGKQTTVIWPMDVEYEPPFEDEPAIVNNYIIDDVCINPSGLFIKFICFSFRTLSVY